MKQNLSSKDFDWLQVWEKNKVSFILALAGLVLVALGFFSFVMLHQQEAEIEIFPAEEVAEEATLFVDLKGAVEKPGVYELPADARINDLLITGGGLSAEADREWVEKNLNLAQKLVDGAKIYIPKEGEVIKVEADEEVAGSSAVITGKININTASASELDSLWGIGEVRAKAIIESRPYSSIEELLTKKVIPSNVYERIKDEITAY